MYCVSKIGVDISKLYYCWFRLGAVTRRCNTVRAVHITHCASIWSSDGAPSLTSLGIQACLAGSSVWCLSQPLACRRSAPLCIEPWDTQTLTTQPPTPIPPPRSVLKKSAKLFLRVWKRKWRTIKHDFSAVQNWRKKLTKKTDSRQIMRFCFAGKNTT